MNRLTEKLKNGTWRLKGLPWEKIFPNKQVSFAQEEYEALYGALCKLKDYEDTGLSPDDAKRVNDFEQSQAGHLLLKLNQEQKKHRWIPVGKRMPDPGKIVLVNQMYSWEHYEDGAMVTIGRLRPTKPGNMPYWEFQYYRPDFRCGTIMDNGIICPGSEYVTAWQPLPEPYRDDGEN